MESMDLTPAREPGYHRPVLLEEVLGFLLPSPGPILDGTVGGGGHARALLDRDPSLELIAVDRDPEALEEATTVLAPHAHRVRFVRAEFRDAVEAAGIPGEVLGGVLLDLGVSSHQLDEDVRGFAFRPGVPLDMRMAGGSSGEASAADLLRTAEQEELARIFREYGEEPRARKLAREIVRRRESGESPETSDDLVAALTRSLGRPARSGEKARVFQALRIAVNRELEGLIEALPRFRDALRPTGTLAVIAYHSLEDRIVKNSFREWSRSCVCPPELPVCRCRGRALGQVLTPRPLRPAAEEVEENPRARSALLRAWRKAA
jgi:16S rRNA (cytosine1402-N4)-methyltransferase